MESAERRSQRDYTMTFKLSVVDQVEKGELSYREAQERYGIQGKTTVLTWLRKHGRQKLESRRIHWRAEDGDHARAKPTINAEQRIKELEEQLALSNQKAQFFEAVVDVLQTDYGLSVVKKRPGKSSRKNASKT